jgi:transposase-like protein
MELSESPYERIKDAVPVQRGNGAIQHSQESLKRLSVRYGINPKTVAKWRKRESHTGGTDGAQQSLLQRSYA